MEYELFGLLLSNVLEICQVFKIEKDILDKEKSISTEPWHGMAYSLSKSVQPGYQHSILTWNSALTVPEKMLSAVVWSTVLLNFENYFLFSWYLHWSHF